jgi:hypothetical protein
MGCMAVGVAGLFLARGAHGRLVSAGRLPARRRRRAASGCSRRWPRVAALRRAGRGRALLAAGYALACRRGRTTSPAGALQPLAASAPSSCATTVVLPAGSVTRRPGWPTAVRVEPAPSRHNWKANRPGHGADRGGAPEVPAWWVLLLAWPACAACAGATRRRWSPWGRGPLEFNRDAVHGRRAEASAAACTRSTPLLIYAAFALVERARAPRGAGAGHGLRAPRRWSWP